jgi:hypothetical protein
MGNPNVPLKTTESSADKSKHLECGLVVAFRPFSGEIFEWMRDGVSRWKRLLVGGKAAIHPEDLGRLMISRIASSLF